MGKKRFQISWKNNHGGLEQGENLVLARGWLLCLRPAETELSWNGDIHWRLRKKGNFLKGEGGKGWAWSQIIRPQESLAFSLNHSSLSGENSSCNFTTRSDPEFPSMYINILFLTVQVVERLYCKRPILCLSSSKILTPHPPLRPAIVYPPPLVGGEDTLARGRGGVGGHYFGRRETQLCTLHMYVLCGPGTGWSGRPHLSRDPGRGIRVWRDRPAGRGRHEPPHRRRCLSGKVAQN